MKLNIPVDSIESKYLTPDLRKKISGGEQTINNYTTNVSNITNINGVIKAKCVSITNISLNDTTTIIDGYTCVQYDIILIVGQTDKTENGIYKYDTTFTRYDFEAGELVAVLNGTDYVNSLWKNSNNEIDIGTTEIDFEQINVINYFADVNIDTPINNEVLTYKDGEWVNLPVESLPAGTSGQTLRHNGTGWEGNDILTIKEVSDNYPEGNTVEIYKESTSFLGSDARLKVKHKQFGLSGNYQIQESQVVAGASGEIGLIAKRNSYNNLGEDEDIQFDVEFSNQRIKNSLFAEEYSEDKIIGVDAFGEFKKMDGISITDERVKVNIDDPESGFLEDKIESVDDRIVINNTGSTLELSLDIPSPNLMKSMSTDLTDSVGTFRDGITSLGFSTEASVIYELTVKLAFGNVSSRNGSVRMYADGTNFTFRPFIMGNFSGAAPDVIYQNDSTATQPFNMDNGNPLTFQTTGTNSIYELKGMFISSSAIPNLRLQFKTDDIGLPLVLKAYSYMKISR